MTIRNQTRSAFTLLEIMLAITLLSLLLGILWGVTQVYYGHYLAAEKKASRSQFVRSLAAMLEHDLASAIQDPIHPMLPSEGESGRYIRRFGLRGSRHELQIDVVEPDALARHANRGNNRWSDTNANRPASPQVPELKTVIYDFVSPAAPDQDNTSSNVSETGDSSGSKWVGSLQTSEPLYESMEPVSLVRKYGLARRELDFETPSLPDESELVPQEIRDGSQWVGSLAAPPDFNRSQLHSENPDPTARQREDKAKNNSPLTAAQLAVDTEENVIRAPEVVDCHFRYFDGNTWFEKWDSIEQNGLPVAIEVTLRILPLDDVETLRQSPELISLARQSETTLFPASTTNGSTWVGSLQTGNNSADEPIGPTMTLANPPEQKQRKTLDTVVEELGLGPLQDRRIVTWLPTTPLSKHRILERRLPILTHDRPDRNDRTNTLTLPDRNIPNPQLNDRTIANPVIQERTPRESASPSLFDSIDQTMSQFSDEPFAEIGTGSGSDFHRSAAPPARKPGAEPAKGWIRSSRKP